MPGHSIKVIPTLAFLTLFVISCTPSFSQKRSQKLTLDNTTVEAVAIPSTKPSFVNDFLEESDDKLDWNNIKEQLGLGDPPKDGSIPPCVFADPRADMAYVFHVVHWGGNYSVLSSSWSAYDAHPKNIDNPDPKKRDATLVREVTASGDPLLYGKKSVLLIGINYPDNVNGLSGLLFSYKISVTQGTPQNIQDLSQLVNALLGVSPTNLAAAKAELPARVAFACISGTPHLPFSLNIVETVAPAKTNGADQNNDEKQENSPKQNGSGHSESRSGPSASEVDLIEENPQEASQPSPGQAPAGANASPQSESGSGSAPPANTGTKGNNPTSSNAKPASGQVDCTALNQANNGGGGTFF